MLLGVGEISAGAAASLSSAPNPNLALEQFARTDSANGGVTFDYVSWAGVAHANASWADASWADASWADASWADASWADTSQEDGAHGDGSGAQPATSSTAISSLKTQAGVSK